MSVYLVTEEPAKLHSLKQLPASCYESALMLERSRALFEDSGVFSPALIDGTIAQLKAYDDARIREQVAQHPALMNELVKRYYHCG